MPKHILFCAECRYELERVVISNGVIVLCVACEAIGIADEIVQGRPLDRQVVLPSRKISADAVSGTR